MISSLYPIESETREIKTLDGIWDFAVDRSEDGEAQGWVSGLSEGKSPMPTNGNRKGVFTRQRQPKAAAHYLRERWIAKIGITIEKG